MSAREREEREQEQCIVCHQIRWHKTDANRFRGGKCKGCRNTPHKAEGEPAPAHHRETVFLADNEEVDGERERNPKLR
jgi:hypothetical protein